MRTHISCHIQREDTWISVLILHYLQSARGGHKPTTSPVIYKHYLGKTGGGDGDYLWPLSLTTHLSFFLSLSLSLSLHTHTHTTCRRPEEVKATTWPLSLNTNLFLTLSLSLCLLLSFSLFLSLTLYTHTQTHTHDLGKTGGGEGDDLASRAVDEPAGAVNGFRQHYLCLYLCMRPSATRVCGLKATSVCGVNSCRGCFESALLMPLPVHAAFCY